MSVNQIKLKFKNFFGNFDGSNGFKLIVYTKLVLLIFLFVVSTDLV